MKQFLKSENGQAMVEFALTLPILLMLLCGIIDFGWIFSNKLILSNCSREGARAAVVAAGVNVTQTATDRAKSAAPESMRSSLLVNVSVDSSGNAVVVVSDLVSVLTPVGGIFTGGDKINLSSSTTMLAS